MEMALIGNCHVVGYCSRDAKDLLATAQRLGIDAAKIRAELTVAAKKAIKKCAAVSGVRNGYGRLNSLRAWATTLAMASA